MKNKASVLMAIIMLSISFAIPKYVSAQHEGHKMQTETKEEAKPKMKKPASKKAAKESFFLSFRNGLSESNIVRS